MIKRNFSSTVLKCLQVLDIVGNLASAQNGTGVGLKDVVKRSGFDPATSYRYLQTLEECGLVQRGMNGDYTLGLKIVELYYKFVQSSDLGSVCHSYMSELCSETNETVYLGILDGTEVFYLGRIDSPLPIRPHTVIGGRNKLYCTGLGKAILAFSEDSLVDQVIQNGLVARTKATITNPNELTKDLEEAKTRGFAYDRMENEDQVHCVASPIYNHTGRVIAALSISGPAFRMSLSRMENDLGPKVMRVCHTISTELGFQLSCESNHPAYR